MQQFSLSFLSSMKFSFLIFWKSFLIGCCSTRGIIKYFSMIPNDLWASMWMNWIFSLTNHFCFNYQSIWVFECMHANDIGISFHQQIIWIIHIPLLVVASLSTRFSGSDNNLMAQFTDFLVSLREKLNIFLLFIFPTCKQHEKRNFRKKVEIPDIFSCHWNVLLFKL